MANENEIKTQNNNEESSIDIKKLVFIFLDKWYLFAIGVFVALVVGFIINRFSPRVYQTRGTVLIKSDRSTMDATAIMTNINYSSFQNIDNEIAIMKSYSMIEKAVKKMNLEVTYMGKGRVSSVELYKTAPFTVEIDTTKPQVTNLPYQLTILDNGKIHLKASAKFYSYYDYITERFSEPIKNRIKFEGEYDLGEWIDNGYNCFRIVLNDRYNPENQTLKLSFWLNSYSALIKQMQAVSITSLSKQASVAIVSMAGNDRQKIVEFVNTLLEVYVNRGLEKKNAVSESTIKFINDELATLQVDLNVAEQDLSDFRTDNNVVDLNLQASMVFTNLRLLDKEKAEMLVALKTYKRLQDYFISQIDDPEHLAAPSTMGIEDLLLNRLVSELVSLSQTKAIQMLTLTEHHPQIQKLDEQIVTTKKTILETVSNLVSNTEISLRETEKQIAKFEADSKLLPEKQQKLIQYERNFNFNDATYKYLMQRLAEAQILKASNTPDNEILDKARMNTTYLIKPRSKMNYLIALILGLLIPAVVLFLKDYFNMTITNRADVEKLTGFPIIGQVAQVESKDPLVVINSPKAPIAEAFRAIRTNIEFITQGKSQSTILVTGDMQGIGKTFNSINMASIYALYGKKTILLGFDMRKPKLFQEFGLTNNIGLSSYLSNKEPLENVIQPSVKIPSLDLITSGPIPPNPAELIASEKCKELFDRLREMYDYIIVDTPPLGLVTDAYLLMRYSDVNLFIVRQNHTNKNIFGSIIRDVKDRNIEAAIVINGIETAKGYGYHYGSYRYGYGGYGGYGYAYGYGYGRYGNSKYGYGSDYYGEDGENNQDGKKKKRHHHHHHSSEGEKKS